MTWEDRQAQQQQLDAWCDALEENTRGALLALDGMNADPVWQEAALKQLCEKLADCKATVFAWACAHGEP